MGDFHSGYDAEGCCVGTLLQAFGGSQLHGLCLGNVHTGSVACTHTTNRTDESDDGGNLDAAFRHVHIPPLEQEPAADGNDEDAPRHPSAENSMRKLDDSRRREGYGKEVEHLVTYGFGVELHAYRMLHPRIGNKNPPCRDCGSEDGEPGGSQVGAAAEFFPTEEHEGDEGGFHEEGQDALNGKRGTEDVADKPRVVRPVCAELKFEDDACGDAYSEVDAEKFLPKLGCTFPETVTGTHIERLHYRHDNAEAQC